MTARVVDLLEVHREIDSLLDATTLAAFTPGAEAALADLLGALKALLLWHLDGEESVLLPLYETHVPDPPRNGSPEQIRRDHRMIREVLEELMVTAGLARARRLRKLAHLLEHHDQREATGFKPLLDAALSPAVRGEALASLAADRPALAATPVVRGRGRGRSKRELAAEPRDEVRGLQQALLTDAVALSSLRERIAAARHALAPGSPLVAAMVRQYDATLTSLEAFGSVAGVSAAEAIQVFDALASADNRLASVERMHARL